jgi:hypothetical protein
MRVLASQLPGAYQGPWVRPTPPIFVIGNTMDPSTPYSGSVTMARQLANARLLTVQGHGHTEFLNPSTLRRQLRTQTINQARALIVTGPDELRARFARHSPAALVAELAALRPRAGDVPGYATQIALRELARRVEFFDAQLARLDG